MPFGDVGRTLISHLYNQDITKNKGKLEAVYTCKQPSGGLWVQDVERGILDTVNAYPWQTDTSIGDWYYRTGQKYKTSTEVIQMLVDIVSKNGNLLLNVVQTPEGHQQMERVFMVHVHGKFMVKNLLTNLRRNKADSMRILVTAQRISVLLQKVILFMHFVWENQRLI